MSSLTGWTASVSDADHVSEVTTDYVKTGNASIRMRNTATSGAFALTKNLATSFVPDDRLFVSMYIPRLVNDAGFGLSAYGNTAANYGAGNAWRNLWNLTGITQRAEPRIGWGLYPISFANTTVDLGSPLLTSAYASFRFGLPGIAAAYREVILDGIIRYRAKPACIIQFDGSADSQYTEGFSYCQPLGIPITHHVYTDFINTPGRMTKAQMLEMIAYGCEVGMDGEGSAGVDSWGENPAKIRIEQEKVANISGVLPVTCAYPQGEYGVLSQLYDEVFETLEDCGFQTARTIKRGPAYLGYQSPYTLPRTINPNSDSTLSDWISDVDYAIKTSGTVIVAGHKIGAVADSVTCTVADWQALIDHIDMRRKQGLLSIMTTQQWWSQRERPLLAR